MTKKFGLLTLYTLLALCLSGPLGLQVQNCRASEIQVAILPFGVHSTEDIGHLAKAIPLQLGELLEKEGAVASLVDELPQDMSMVALRRLGRDAGADWLAWGSFSMLGQTWSLDAKLLSVDRPLPVASYFAEGTGMEAIALKLKDLAAQMAVTVLGRQKIAAIRVEGSQSIDPEAIKRVMGTKAGDIYNASALSNDMNAIFAMGFFEDIAIEANDVPGGKEVVVTVKIKPRVRSVSVEGASAIKTADVEGVLDISRGSILNPFRVEENIRRIEALYNEKSYYNAQISYRAEQIGENEADLVFVIDEGEKVRIREIRFEGNSTFTDRKLKGVMKTKEKGIFSFVTGRGTMKPEQLIQDTSRIAAFYHNNGFVRAKVGQPEEVIEGRWIYITIPVEEGERYKVGAVDIDGDLILEREELLARTKIGNETYYNQEVVRQDMMVLTDIYSDSGYAWADIVPRTRISDEGLTVDILYEAQKGEQVYYEEILIGGNTKTRDYVIRRALPIQEQSLYSGSGLKYGLRNLQSLDFFEDVQVDTLEGSAPDKMIVRINVEEKPTGAFTFGGGYSSLDNFFFVSKINQRNLLGRGQTLGLEARIGSATSLYNLAFTEPYLFGSRLSFGTDIYRWERDYDTYTKLANGGRIRLGYQIWRYTRIFVTYGYESADVRDVTRFAPYSVQTMMGQTVESSLSTSLVYDSRNHPFQPTRGWKSSATIQYAGAFLGGDVAFTKYTAEAGYYFPIFWRFVGFLRAEGGFVEENTSHGFLPVYSRFYLGGINSLRGYTWEQLSPVDANYAYIGGDKFAQANAELLIPIIEKAGLVGVVFYDTGDLYDNHQGIDFGSFKKTWGVGIRWFSPLGPIRLERGFILDPPPGVDAGGRWEFSMGMAF
ncbi:MAG: outer membrane protein assembly factor BamA [Desulfatibacillaceae bacterium]|nr:outer membrane protein assembly factor BamA [Desulfatibacillaceae bacterium]